MKLGQKFLKGEVDFGRGGREHVGSFKGEGYICGLYSFSSLLVLRPRMITCPKFTIVGDSSHCSQLQRTFFTHDIRMLDSMC